MLDFDVKRSTVAHGGAILRGGRAWRSRGFKFGYGVILNQRGLKRKHRQRLRRPLFCFEKGNNPQIMELPFREGFKTTLLQIGDRLRSIGSAE